jgi:hypothetical protein
MVERLKSGPATHVSHILILNLTGFEIDANWINHNGFLVKYATIGHRKHWQCKTYAGHPWIFCKAGTRDRMNIIGGNRSFENVLMPKPYADNEEEKCRMYGIIRPVHSLKGLCFRTLSSLCNIDEDKILLLQLPRTIVQEYTDFIQNIMT